jgi:hypothetical protein
MDREIRPARDASRRRNNPLISTWSSSYELEDITNVCAAVHMSHVHGATLCSWAMKHHSRLANLPDESPYHGIFRFEVDFGGTLRCIPMSVRMKLDQTGIKLSLKQWNRIPPPGRRELVERPCTTAVETEEYKKYLVSQIEAHTRTTVEYAPLDASPPWALSGAVPERICAWARGLGVAPPSGDQWAALTPLQRFALFKLTRPGHSNENFLPAMREFSLLQ